MPSPNDKNHHSKLDTPNSQLLHPSLLTIHPALKDQPEWAEDDAAFAAFCRDIQSRGFDVPIKINAKHQLIDGRQRLRAAKRIKLENVPCVIVSDDDVPTLILHYILQRRHYSKSALAYMAAPLIAGRSNSLAILSQEFGISERLLQQAQQVRDLFAEGDIGAEYKAEIEPEIIAGDVSLGGVLAGWAGRAATKGQTKQTRADLDLWDRSLHSLENRFKTWDKFDEPAKATVLARFENFVEAMPPDLLAKLTAKLRLESKRRSAEI